MSKPTQTSRRDLLALLGSASAASLLPASSTAQQQIITAKAIEVAYTIADAEWPYLRGNHRVRIEVAQAADAVRVSIPWRRLDPNPDQKAILLFDSSDAPVTNIKTESISAFSGEIIFEARTPGDYFLYYLPHKEVHGPRSALGPKGAYLPPQSSNWSPKISATPATARVVEFQARTARDSFFPMEIPSTEEELRAMRQKFTQPVLLFAEDREHPIKMYEHLPVRWIQRGPQKTFAATALRGEFFVMQLGLYSAADSGISNEPVTLKFSELASTAKAHIPTSAWTCLNTTGVDVLGNAFQKEIRLDAGKVLPLWCGVQLPLEIKPGLYKGTITAAGKHGNISIDIELQIKNDFIRAGGDDQPARLSRIGWLNSTIGLEQTRTAPYTPLQLEKRTISCLGRTITLAVNGLPSSIKVNGQELLAFPIEFSIVGASPTAHWTHTSEVTRNDDSAIVFKSISAGDGFEFQVITTVEFDGGIGFDVTLTSQRSRTLDDIALQISYAKDKVPYSVGMNLRGGNRPASWQWKWSDQKPGWKEQGSNLEYFLWLGSVDSGLFCRLKSPLQDWQNDNKGGIGFTESGNTLRFRASTGAHSITSNGPLHFNFRLLPTPVKPLLPEQRWSNRYAHAYEPPAYLKSLDATVINIHQGKLPNRYINYPFLNLDLLTPYVSEAHALGMKVKLYYTMRELTTYLPELWTFRSLGDEIYRVGGTQGQGNPQLDFWLQEHLHSDYSPGWIQQLSTGEIDSSLRIKSDSRLANFYLEGLKWLLDNVPIDGLYLDEIGYSRSTMQRVRRVLQRRAGAMIDMHGNHDWWSCNCPIGYYMEHLPYIDRLWLGEGFNPEWPADFWLIEMSGIPFGLSSDLLEHPNPWRGMLFGMTDRALYGGPSPTPIWQLWDQFGIADAKMFGWWQAESPVAIKHDQVFATVYAKPGKCLIAIATWSKQNESVSLQIDWQKLGIDPSKATITAPELSGLQEPQKFSRNQQLTLAPGKGYLLLVEQS